MQKSIFKYLNIGLTEKKWGLYITSVGYSKIKPHENYPNNQTHPTSHQLTWNRGRILNDYYVVFISTGSGVFGSANTPPAEIESGTCFFLFPGMWHRYKPNPRSGWEEYWIGFNGFYIEKLMKTFFKAENPVINVDGNRDILILFQRLIDAITASDIGYQQQLAGITLQVLGLINTTCRHKEYKNDPIGKLISKAKFILQNSFENQVNMANLARQLPMGYASFRKAFKKISGESPNQYHLKLRMNRARDLLTNTTLTINEVADQAGFDSVYYFSKLFKKKNGVSPNTFRKSIFIQKN